MLGFATEQVWDTELAFEHLRRSGEADSKRTAERRLQSLKFLPDELSEDQLLDELGRHPQPLTEALLPGLNLRFWLMGLGLLARRQ